MSVKLNRKSFTVRTPKQIPNDKWIENHLFFVKVNVCRYVARVFGVDESWINFVFLSGQCADMGEGKSVNGTRTHVTNHSWSYFIF